MTSIPALRGGASAAGIHPRPLLEDGFGRRIRKLRVSLNDACNFRCFYCMPEHPRFTPGVELLPARELARLVGALTDLGITEVRLTGGEPTLRADFGDVVAALSRLPLARLGLTTNGFLLDAHLEALAASTCRHLNVSLDSLRADRFAAITGSAQFGRVRANVLEARRRGLAVKVNVVVARGVNDDELAEFVEFSAEHRIPVRFLELMRIGPRWREHAALFVSADEMLTSLHAWYELEPLPDEPDATAFRFRSRHGAEIGFIASESRPFCASCSRLRLSATGHLRACLMSDAGRHVRGLEGAALEEALRAVMVLKPPGRVAHHPEPMYRIGG